MSVLLILDGTEAGESYQDGPFYLCSNSAWADCAQRCALLPPHDFPRLIALAATGQCEATDELATEIGGVLDAGGQAVGVAATLAAMLDRIGTGDADESASVADEDDMPDGATQPSASDTPLS